MKCDACGQTMRTRELPAYRKVGSKYFTLCETCATLGPTRDDRTGFDSPYWRAKDGEQKNASSVPENPK